MKRIPFRWLTDSCTYEKYTGVNLKNAPTYATAISLAHIRLEYDVRHYSKATGKVIVDDAVLFYDPFWSTPKSVDFLTESRIAVGIKTFKIDEIIPLNDETGNIHHYELKLVGAN